MATWSLTCQSESLLQHVDSVAMAHGLSSCSPMAAVKLHRLSSWCAGFVALWNISSPPRDQTQVLCIGRWILNPWISREIKFFFVLNLQQFGFDVFGNGLFCAYPV